MRQRLNTLRVRFALWTAALLLVILSAFSLYVYGSLATRLSTALDESLNLASAQVIAAIEDEPRWTAAEPDIARLLARGYSIRVTTPDGNPLWTVGPEHEWPGSATRFTTLPESTNGPLRVWSSITMLNPSLMVVVQVAQSLAEVEATLSQLRLALFISVPLLVAVAGVGGYFLAARALAPIDRITRTARRISAEDLSARLGLPATDDEVGRLATTFDAMLARLDDSFRRERRFTADASHELRTPLTAMQAILDSVRHRQRTPAEYEQALADLAEETDRLRALAEDLLRLARGSGPAPAPREVVDLSTLVRDVAEAWRPLAETKGLTLTCDLPEGLSVSGVSDDLIRLFANVLDNAIKFTREGNVAVSVKQTETEFVQVVIADTGPGISAEHLPHIFDRFYRGDDSRSGSRGAGLGLAIAADIARAHGGHIEAGSVAGQGARFTVVLPLNDPR